MIYLAAENGVIVCDKKDWRIVRRGLEGRRFTSIIARDRLILAGSTNGILRSDDAGMTWHESGEGLSQPHIRWLIAHPDHTGLFFAGTEPAAIFSSSDGAGSWQEATEVAKLRDQHNWFLPYSPEAGCVRGFAVHGSRAFAAVEVGGVLRSDDSGSSWQLVEGSDGNPNLMGSREPLIHPDVHSIHVHPSSPELIYAPTGGGFYRSIDGGRTWRRVYACYCRAAWIDPSDPDHIILGPADSVDRNGRIEETRDGGETWQITSEGLVIPWPNHMVERFTQVGADLFAVLSNGQLISTLLESLSWREPLPGVREVNAIAADNE